MDGPDAKPHGVSSDGNPGSSSQSSDARGVLHLGSDVEIAGRLRDELVEEYGLVIHSEGSFWRHAGTHWLVLSSPEIRRHVHAFDGALYLTASGGTSKVKLTRGRIDSILHEFTALVSQPDYFVGAPMGVNCASGFIIFDKQGTPRLEPHHCDHRARHALPGHWSEGAASLPPKGSLLHQLLNGTFLGDTDKEDKISIVGELCGSAALGYATRLAQPKAIILKGETAENGKSAVLDVARGLLPASAVSCVPASRVGDDRHVVGLVGKLLNATDELSSTAIASDTFKAIVTGEPISGRDVYCSRTEFRPVAQHLFATNVLPPFKGGMDRGVQRRLLVLPFNRTIPLQERIEHLGQRIATEEPDLLLAFAVDGAARLIRQGKFTETASTREALANWLHAEDPIAGWVRDCVEVVPLDSTPAVSTLTAYESLLLWAEAEGISPKKLPARNVFALDVPKKAIGVEFRRRSGGGCFLGLKLLQVQQEEDDRRRSRFRGNSLKVLQ